MKKKINEIKSIIEPQLSSDGGGIKWYRTISPAHAIDSDPFFALEVFRAGGAGVESPNPTPRILRDVSFFTYLMHGHYSLRVDNEIIKQATSGDFIALNAGKSSVVEEVFLPDNGFLEGFRLWVNQKHNNRTAKSISINPDSSKINIDQQAGQIQVLLGKAYFNDDADEMPDINLLDVSLQANYKLKWKAPLNHQVIVFVFQGRGYFGPYRDEDQVLIPRHQVLLYGHGADIMVQTQDTPVRFLIATGVRNNQT